MEKKRYFKYGNAGGITKVINREINRNSGYYGTLKEVLSSVSNGVSIEFYCHDDRLDADVYMILNKEGHYRSYFIEISGEENKMTKIKEEMHKLGFVTTYDGSILLRYIGKSKDVVIPEGIVEICGFAFEDKKLTSVVFPKSLVEIGPKAFISNNLTSVEFPDSLRCIRDKAFMYNKLPFVDLNNVRVVGEKAFSENDRLGAKLRNVEEIGDLAFDVNIQKKPKKRGKDNGN